MTITGARVADTVRVSVGDDGPGVPAERLEAIFQPFERASYAQRGSGLGLSIAQSLVVLHGGRMWAERGAAGGLAVHIELPAGEAVDEP